MNITTGTLNTEYDIIICGAGLAGLTLARQIAREIPDASLLLIEGCQDKSRTNAIQVGESTIEISANYLANVVDLREYLETSHLRKWGLRFFFCGGHMPLQDRPEFGTAHASPLPSYQLDRALLETDIKRLNTAVGIPMVTDSKVERITLSEVGNRHEIAIFQTTTNQRQVVRCRWVIDSMGRKRFLQKKLGIAEPQNPLCSAAWFRLRGRIDVGDLVPRSEEAWHARVPNDKRYYSTNHLMGNGRWVWLIPLASDQTSIGIVAREDYFSFSTYNTYERALQWLQEHEPLLWHRINTLSPVDFQCLRHYSYSARQVYSLQRWACTGDAATFSDPFLSPGIDQAGFGNTLITELIKHDRADLFDAQLVERFNRTFLTFHNGTVESIQGAYHFFGEKLVMGAKLLWDFVRGFALNAPQRMNNIYLDEQKVKVLQPILSQIFLLTLRAETLFKEWSSFSTKRYTYRFINYFEIPGLLELYQRNLRGGKTQEELLGDHQATLAYLEELLQIIFLIAIADTIPETLARLPSPLWLNAWKVGLDPRRWKGDKLFVPPSQPRPLKLAEFSSLFGATDLPGLLLTHAEASS